MKALIIGCGGVASVVIHKCCQNSEVFTDIMIASRTKSKCDALKTKLEGITKTNIMTAQVDADDVSQLVSLMKDYEPDICINVALPYQDLHIMDACLEYGCDYLDTANYEPEDTTPGSGRTASASRRQGSPLYSAAASIRVLRACSAHTHRSTTSMR